MRRYKNQRAPLTFYFILEKRLHANAGNTVYLSVLEKWSSYLCTDEIYMGFLSTRNLHMYNVNPTTLIEKKDKKKEEYAKKIRLST